MFWSNWTKISFLTRKILPFIHKDAVLSIQQSMVVYECVCRCDCQYVGAHPYVWKKKELTNVFPNFIQRMQQPSKILPEQKCKIRSTETHQQCVSAIELHSMQNLEYATPYSNDQFSILDKARSMSHLSALEATYIKMNKPIQCRQKDFVYLLQTFSLWQRCSLSVMATLHR